MLIGFCLCLKPYPLELLGLFVTMGGCVFLFNDNNAERVDGKKGEFHVYAICLFCTFLASIFFMINGLLVKTVPIFTLLTLQTIVVCATFPILLTYMYDEYEYFSTDKMMGGFGFLHPDEAVNGVFVFGLSAGFFAMAGWVLCLLFFSPVVITGTFLWEIFISQFLGFMLDIDKLPGWLTWVGTVVVIVGVLLLSKADRQRKNDMEKKAAQIEAEEAAKGADGDVASSRVGIL